MNSLIFNTKIVEAIKSLKINIINQRVYDSYAVNISNIKDSSKSDFRLPAIIIHHDSFKTAKNEAQSETAFYFIAEGDSKRDAQRKCLAIVSAFEDKISDLNSQFKFETYHIFIKGDKNYVFNPIESEPIDEENVFCFFGETKLTMRDI